MDEEGVWSQIELENKFFVRRFVQMFCEDQSVDRLVEPQDDLFTQDAVESATDESDDDRLDGGGDDDDSDDGEEGSDSEEGSDEDGAAVEDEDEDEDDQAGQDETLFKKDADRDSSDDEFENETKQISKRHKLDGGRDSEDDDDTLFKSAGLDQKRLEKQFKEMEGEDELNGYVESEEEGDDESAGDGEEDQPEGEDAPAATAFEQQDKKMRSRISELEAENLQAKPWQLRGETDAASRPQNSLLEEYVDFESGQRPAPIITEEVSKRLEDIIMGRIKDKKFDDVERKSRQAEQPFEYKRRIVLDSEKSKVGLAQLYEKEFLKMRGDEQEAAENPKHAAIRAKMRHLFLQLDSLCNFNYTPKAHVSEIKIVNNLPAISAEEAIPAAISDACLIAPQEIVRPLRGELKGDSERTATDRARERREKKLRTQSRVRFAEQRGAPTTNLHGRKQQEQKEAKKKADQERKDANRPKSARKDRKKQTENLEIRSVFMKNRKN